MCGICGELRFDAKKVAREPVNRMLRELERRGPDASGHYFDGPVGLGHRRLSVIDLSERSNQPIYDRELNLVLVFNGAIYNYRELRKTLQGKGYTFFSDGDSEVIVKAFHAWGEKCVEKLHGMFAFAIWDESENQLFLARDRFGIKPLYFSQQGTHVRFASNMQALLAAGEVDTRIDPVALHHQFTLHGVVPAPMTILRGVRKLEPGTTMMIRTNGDISERRYWQLEATRPDHAVSEEEWIEQIHVALREAVKKRIDVADVPVGVLLSGGLDSSLLVGLLAEAGVNDLLTYSIGFQDIGDEKGSEFEYSDQVVDRFQTKHHKLYIPNEQVLTRLPEAVANMSEPMFGQDAVAFYLLSEQVSKTVKVVQSGQGADEVFGGYFWYPQMQAAQGSDLARFSDHYFDRTHEEYCEMVTSSYQGEDYTSQSISRRLAEPGADEFMDKVLRMDTTMLIVDDPVKRVDNMTMAWGLEARVPFLDHQLVELAARIPPSIKLKSEGKHILKSVARGIVPDPVIDRPKGYFPMPALKYVRGEFLEFMRDILTSQACKQRDIYQNDYIAKLLAEPEQHMTKLNGSKLWHAALLEFWLQTHVDGR